MSEERTPIQALEDAVAAYLNSTSDEGDVPGAWVLCFQTLHLEDNPEYLPVQDDTSYVLSPSNSGALALGMLTLARYELLADLTMGDEDG